MQTATKDLWQTFLGSSSDQQLLHYNAALAYLAGFREPVDVPYSIGITLDSSDNIKVFAGQPFESVDHPSYSELEIPNQPVITVAIGGTSYIEPYNINIPVLLSTDAQIRSSYVGGDAGFSPFLFFSVSDDSLLYDLLVYWYELHLAPKFLQAHSLTKQQAIEAIQIKYNLAPQKPNFFRVYHDLAQMLRMINFYHFMVLARSPEEVGVYEIEGAEMSGTFGASGPGRALYRVTSNIVLTDMLNPKEYNQGIFDLEDYEEAEARQKIKLTLVQGEKYLSTDGGPNFERIVDRLQQLLNQGYVAFAGPGIGRWISDVDTVDQSLDRVITFFRSQQMKGRPLAGLAPPYALYMQPQGRFAPMQRTLISEQEAQVRQICQKERLTKPEFDWLKQQARALGIQFTEPISRTKLCQEVLRQYEIEQGEAYRFKQLQL